MEGSQREPGALGIAAGEEHAPNLTNRKGNPPTSPSPSIFWHNDNFPAVSIKRIFAIKKSR
jgi:hypothetical protein